MRRSTVRSDLPSKFFDPGRVGGAGLQSPESPLRLSRSRNTWYQVGHAVSRGKMTRFCWIAIDGEDAIMPGPMHREDRNVGS